MNYNKIIKPFPGYRWQWASNTPSESLNKPNVFFGCLRVLYENQGKPTNADSVFDGLKQIDIDLSEELKSKGKSKPLRLARTGKRNLFRNSQQYWKNLGLLVSTSQGIEISNLAREYVERKLSRGEFATYIVKTLELPNSHVHSQAEIDDWKRHGISLKPLELILEITYKLYLRNPDFGYLTTEELYTVVIPLVGALTPSEKIVDGVLIFREQPEEFSTIWKAREKDNDHRIIREYLLFLHYYGFLSLRESTLSGKKLSNENQQFFINSTDAAFIASLLGNSVDFSLREPFEQAHDFEERVQISEQIRNKVNVTVTARPSQAKFRKAVLEAGNAVCLLSRTSVKDVLQACHIIQVKDNGSDEVWNGILLRTDLHTLYDKGHFVIHPDGSITKSDTILADPTYKESIPDKVDLPPYISTDALRIRINYGA
ncbi:HNH endonuclease signature motif containing protein [Vibrio sp.]|uniref:HNH endonuclease signature motif containing protein n=1 Tax=Vibrio sp. TaxID=678 RepID=UPI00311D8E4B